MPESSPSSFARLSEELQRRPRLCKLVLFATQNLSEVKSVRLLMEALLDHPWAKCKIVGGAPSPSRLIPGSSIGACQQLVSWDRSCGQCMLHYVTKLTKLTLRSFSFSETSLSRLVRLIPSLETLKPLKVEGEGAEDGFLQSIDSELRRLDIISELRLRSQAKLTAAPHIA